jgi:hypothetical protein
VKKSSSYRKKHKRSAAKRFESGLAAPSLKVKAFLLVVGILGGALTAAGIKNFVLNASSNEIEISDSISSPSTHDTLESPSSRSQDANAPQKAIRPKQKLNPEPAIESVTLAESPIVAKPTKVGSAIRAPRRKAMTVLAAVPVPTPTPVRQAFIPVPVQAAPVKRSEKLPVLNETPLVSTADQPSPSAAVMKIESIKQPANPEKIGREPIKVSSHISKDENLRSRLKRNKRIEVVEVDFEELETATSPFQDRLRKSVK